MIFLETQTPKNGAFIINWTYVNQSKNAKIKTII